jgi:predicted aspartyl protease
MPVEIDGITYSFIVDTGAQCTFIDSSLTIGGNLSTKDRREAADGFWLSNVSVRLNDTSIDLKEVACRDLSSFRHSAGLPIMGILGMDILKDRVVRIDYDNSLIEICNSPTKGKEWDARVEIEMSEEPRPYINSSVNGISVRFLLDTGSAGSIDVETMMFDRIVTNSKRRPLYATSASVGIDGIQAGRLQLDSSEMKIGSLTCNSLRIKQLSNEEPYSILGGQFLCRFNLEIDFPNRTLYLARSKRFTARDCSDNCGMVVEHSWLGIFVLGVVKGDLADSAGIKPTDEILSVDSVSVANHGPRRVMKAIQEPRASDFRIRVKPDGAIHDCSCSIRTRSIGAIHQSEVPEGRGASKE